MFLSDILQILFFLLATPQIYTAVQSKGKAEQIAEIWCNFSFLIEKLPFFEF